VQYEKTTSSPPSLRKPKTKTRKEGPPITKTPDPIHSNNASLTAKDMGFIFPDNNFNPPITPVYCSREAQKRKRPQILIRWEEVSGLDTHTQNLFQNMLNPYLEGILTAKPTKSGFKLHQYPEHLKENWGRCGLRLKRRGESGSAGASLRIVAIPEMKVTVEEEGKPVNHYLFKLGKYVHK